MPPCDDSIAAKETSKDTSSDSVLHNSLKFNSNLRREIEGFIPKFDTYDVDRFGRDFTNHSTINHSQGSTDRSARDSFIETSLAMA